MEAIIKTIDFLKKNKRYELLIKAVVLGLLPLLVCIIRCAIDGKTLLSVFVPASEWNDELFYFKQVEAILEGIYPVGYFGFNESHAELLSFAAWSPVLVSPWVVWGFIFGWGYLSPVLCNIFLLMASIFAFVMLAKPNLRQCICIAVGYVAFSPYTRFAMSSMAEIILTSLVILFYGMAISYNSETKRWKLIVLLLLSAFMILMRPYMAVFILLPVYYSIREYKVKGGIISVSVTVISLGLYFAIKKYLGAEYFADLFFSDWITAFFEEGFKAGCSNLYMKIYTMVYDYIHYSMDGITDGSFVGSMFISYAMFAIILLIDSIAGIIKKIKNKDKNEKNYILPVEIHLCLSFIMMIVAVFLMYKLVEGSRHLLMFISAGIFVCAMSCGKYCIKNAFAAIILAYFFIIRAHTPFDYAMPYNNQLTNDRLEFWSQAFTEYIEINKENVPSYENTIIWEYYDVIDGKNQVLAYQCLYALPEGFGINCCQADYLMENIDGLSCEYLLLVPGGEVDRIITEKGYTFLTTDGEVNLYRKNHNN